MVTTPKPRPISEIVDEIPGAPNERWIAIRLRRGEFSGYRGAGGKWYMSEAQVAAAVESLSNSNRAARRTGLTSTSARRVKTPKAVAAEADTA